VVAAAELEITSQSPNSRRRYRRSRRGRRRDVEAPSENATTAAAATTPSALVSPPGGANLLAPPRANLVCEGETDQRKSFPECHFHLQNGQKFASLRSEKSQLTWDILSLNARMIDRTALTPARDEVLKN
jgi:hypothetical protein